MAVITYKRLALDWQPSDKNSQGFNRLAVAVLVAIIMLAVLLSLVPVPEKERRTRVEVPDRIAKFINQREKPPVPVQPPLPKPEPKPLPKVEPRPTVERQRPSEVERKPLTETEKKAREVAEQSGLLALSSELHDLMDTSATSAQVAGTLSQDSAGANAIAGHDANIVTAGVAAGGGGVESGRYTGQVGGTELSAREVAAVRSGLFADEPEAADSKRKVAATRSGNGRSEEDVTIIFDRNKGSLYSLYERERRKTPGLQGKIVLRITIAPSGEVTDVKIVSSELNNPALEARLISRIKMFKFEAHDVDPVTVTYPIEFLPS
ncbi:MAG: AgmX/PglI C-terminal domain-containing protein [Cellvibrio sp.]